MPHADHRPTQATLDHKSTLQLAVLLETCPSEICIGQVAPGSANHVGATAWPGGNQEKTEAAWDNLMAPWQKTLQAILDTYNYLRSCHVEDEDLLPVAPEVGPEQVGLNYKGDFD